MTYSSFLFSTFSLFIFPNQELIDPIFQPIFLSFSTFSLFIFPHQELIDPIGNGDEFLREAAIMSDFDHPNVVRFIGVVWQAIPHCPKYLVLELLEGGDLLSFVRNYRPIKVNISVEF